MGALHLTEDDCGELLPMADALAVLETAFLSAAAGRISNVPRVRAKAPGFVLHAMTAASEDLGRAAFKCYSTTRSGARFWVGLLDTVSGELLAVLAADRLGRIRTGAVTGLAVKALTEPAADELGLFGCGSQAETQLEAIAAVRALRRVDVYSRNIERRQEFARRMAERTGLIVEAVDHPEEAAANPLVVTATGSRTPVCPAVAIFENAFVAAVGGNALDRTELPPELFERVGRVVCDDVDACRHEAGELHAAERLGLFAWTRAEGLGQVLSRATPPPSEGLTVFKSVGLAFEDLAVASLIYDRARAAGRGTELPF